MILLAALAAFAAGAASAGWLASRGPRRWLVDRPNARSLHDRPVSRAGGVANVAGTTAGLAILALSETPAPAAGWVLAGALIVGVVSLADDLWRVSPAIRMACHLAAAACVVAAGLLPERLLLPGASLALGPAAGAAFTLLFVAWFVNLYNFMDGMDGFAGGMAVIGFTTLAGFGAASGADALAGVGAAAAASSLGFLLFNFPPAKVFLGDLGSTLLGYLCAVAMLWAARSAAVPLWISGLVFSPFIVDASVTIARRAAAGERPWRAHRTHFYQRLVRLGWGHRRTVVVEYGLMVACAGSAAAALRLPPGAQAALAGAWAIAYVLFMLGVARLEGGGGRVPMREPARNADGGRRTGAAARARRGGG